MVSVVTMKTAIAEDEGLPIVFLDIDDVLCLNNPYGAFDALEAVKGTHANPDRVLREIFAAEPTRVLESVHKEMDGQLRYVISSSWRQVFSREQIERVFRTADAGFVAVGLHENWETPRRPLRTDRSEEIESWLHRYHQGEPFVILDDDYSGTSLTGIDEDLKHPLAARVVICPVGVGLTVEHLPIILDALRRPFAVNSKERHDLPESGRPSRNV
jgi:HAD domain in Swiss Army Knife RNA repair proteins